MLLLTFRITLRPNITLCNKMKKITKLFTLTRLIKFSKQQIHTTDSQLIISIEETYIKSQVNMNRLMKVMTKQLASNLKMHDTYTKRDLLMNFKIKKVSKMQFKCTKEHYKQTKITSLLVFILVKCSIKTQTLMTLFNVLLLSFKIQT